MTEHRVVTRRHFMRGASAGAAAAALTGLLPAPARGQARTRTLKIGYVSPQTGPLAGFGEADSFVIGGVRKAIGKGLTLDGVTLGTGTTGALIYLNLLRISPDAAFSINWTAYTIFIVVIGGLGTLEGPIVGTLVFFLLREVLADHGAWYMILLGILAVLAMLQCPQGLWGLVAARWNLRFFPVERIVRGGPRNGPPPGARSAAAKPWHSSMKRVSARGAAGMRAG